eukprot:755411-Hanusia_phi.AAC.5
MSHRETCTDSWGPMYFAEEARGAYRMKFAEETQSRREVEFNKKNEEEDEKKIRKLSVRSLKSDRRSGRVLRSGPCGRSNLRQSRD